MGFLDFFRPKMTEKQLSQLQNAINNNLQSQLNSLTLYPNYKTIDNAERYCTTDDVYSIVRLLATTAAMIPFYGYTKDKDGNLIDLPEADPLNLLLAAPIAGMNRFEAMEALYATLYVQGEFILLKEMPELGPNKGKVKQLHYLPPQNVNIKVSSDFPIKILSYQFVENGKIIYDNIPVEQVIHVKYFNFKTGVGGENLRGYSPLQALAKRLSRIDSNIDVSTAQMQNGGVPGIVYEKMNTDGIKTVVDNRKDNFYRYLQNSSNKGAPYFSHGDLGYIELGLKLADLETAELAKIDFKKLCNAFGVSDILFNNSDASTESNVKIMTKRLYTNTILPDVMRVGDAFNKGLITDGKTIIKHDISEVTELQEDLKAKADMFAALPFFIPNDVLMAFDYEASKDPLMGKVYIKNGYQLLEDVGGVGDLTDTGDYAQNNNQ